ncbi:MAG TPA: hypothetical protein VIM62_00700 [Acidobacteriaceae bacterium]
MKVATVLCLVLSMSVCSCSRANTQTVKTPSIKLPSGGAVEVLGIVAIHFTNGPPALMLKYQTTKAIDDKTELREEAGEVWDKFRPQVEKQGYKNAILSANDAPTGFIFTSNSTYNFVFDQRPDGSWHCSFDDKKQQ